MKKYIYYLSIFLLSFLLFGCAKKQAELNDLQIIKNRGYIIVGTKTDSPPFGYYNKEGKLVGFDIDIAYNRYIVDAKSILGVYGLDMTKVLTVTYNGYNPEFESYLSHLAIAC